MTGLIYVILISLWGVVLVPRWLRHHDESRRRREAARVERALNPHRQHEPAQGDLADDHYQSWREYLRSLARRDPREHTQWLETLRTPRGRHARRRRTIVLALSGMSVVGILGAFVGIVPGFVAVSGVLLLGGYLTLMFIQMRQWESQRDQRSDQAAPMADRPVGRPAAATTDGVRLVGGTMAVGSEWEPRETTLPTYTAKSKASKVPRRIDLTRQGWNGASMVEQARAQQSPHLQQQFEREFAAVEPDPDQQIEELANRSGERYYRRAVNE
ncbi:MAG: hypothetical protein U0R64_03240 [Candidatus Nanopelagicales bacterium]